MLARLRDIAVGVLVFIAALALCVILLETLGVDVPSLAARAGAGLAWGAVRLWEIVAGVFGAVFSGGGIDYDALLAVSYLIAWVMASAALAWFTWWYFFARRKRSKEAPEPSDGAGFRPFDNSGEACARPAILRVGTVRRAP